MCSFALLGVDKAPPTLIREPGCPQHRPLRARTCPETRARAPPKSGPSAPQPAQVTRRAPGHTWRRPLTPPRAGPHPGTLSGRASAAEQGHGSGASGGRPARAPAGCTVPAGRRARACVRPGPLPDGAAAGSGAGRGGHGGAADRRVRAAAGARPRLRRPAHLLGRAARLPEPARLDPLVHRQHRDLAPGARARLRPAALGAGPPGAQALPPLICAGLILRPARRARLPGNSPRRPRAPAARHRLPPRAPAARYARGRARGGGRGHRVSPSLYPWTPGRQTRCSRWGRGGMEEKLSRSVLPPVRTGLRCTAVATITWATRMPPCPALSSPG